jgi:hypothetical protein
MRQPDITQETVVPLVVEDELAVSAETGVSFAVTVKVRCEIPGSVRVVKVEHGAFTDIEEQTDVLAAPVVEIC